MNKLTTRITADDKICNGMPTIRGKRITVHTDYINVSGYQNNPKGDASELSTSLALEFISWNEWLGMDIDENSLKTFNELEIISHCIYEMTFIGFEEEIKAEQATIIKICNLCKF